MFDQSRLAGWGIVFGAMLLAVAVSGAVSLFSHVTGYVGIFLPAIMGAGLLTAGLVSKRDNGSDNRQLPPERNS